MPAKIRSLKISSYRGATQPAELSFEKDRKVTLIFGENGTGKSTIADAIEFVCNQNFGSLEKGYGLGAPAKNFIPAAGKKDADVLIELSDGTDTWTGALTPDGPVVSPAGCPDAQVLRRSSILELVEAQPKERFEVLRAFVELPGIEASERSLRDSQNDADRRLNESVRSLEQAQSELARLWKLEGAPGTSALAWAQEESSRDVVDLKKAAAETASLSDLISSAKGDRLRLDSALEALTGAEDAKAVRQAALEGLEAKAGSKNADLVRLLREAKAYVTSNAGVQSCPVCEQFVDPKKLVAELSARVEAMGEIGAAVSALAISEKNVSQKASQLETARRHFCESGRTAGKALRTSELEEVKTAGVDWSDFQRFLTDSEVSSAMESLARELVSAVDVCVEPLKSRAAADTKTLNHRNAVRGHADAVERNMAEARRLERLVSRLSATLEVVSGERKKYVEDLLAGIADDVEVLYLQIHPGEALGKIRLFLRPNMIGSLELEANFGGAKDIPPRAYYSDSHLDTLGICLFIALARRFKTDKTILVLDDALTSVDAPHLDRFIKMLHEQAVHFNQVIVTTHYRPWRDRYRWGKGGATNTQVIELGPWTLAGGINSVKFLTAFEDLRVVVAAAPFDRQSVASKAGIVLESLLDFLTLKYRCRVKRNARGEYALGELADAVDAKLSKVLRTRVAATLGGSKVEHELKPLLEASQACPWVRNTVGCHFNHLASEVSDAEVRAFGDSVVALGAKMICAQCKTLPTHRPSGSYWECKCGGLELHPLISPGADISTVDDEA